MIKQLLLISPLVLLGVAMDISSNSAPASSSGAPGETNCTTSGCHDTYKVNSGSGISSINFESGITSYKPGQTYTITVGVSQSNLMRFGFELVALNKGQNNSGTLTAIDPSRNQIIKGYGNFSARRYITYTYMSTNAVNPGYGEWTFKWTAPTTDEGDINFYLATIAADNNGNDAGDYCYTRSTILSSEKTSVPSQEFSIKVFPNPARDVVNLEYTLAQNSNVKIELTNSIGENMQELDLGMQSSGNYTLPFSLIKSYGKGVYFIRFIQDENVTIKRIMLTQ